jgi:oxygen-independent coproporphyrinogen-3 oxidase
VAGLYIHIPFCRQKCRYCSFYSIEGGQALFTPLIEALILELKRIPDSTAPFTSAYIGGGTPTFLPIELLIRLVDTVTTRLAPGTEFTIECNPASATRCQPPFHRRTVV